MHTIFTHSSDIKNYDEGRTCEAALMNSSSSSSEQATPRKATIDFIRQFARCYQPVLAISAPALCDFVAN